MVLQAEWKWLYKQRTIICTPTLTIELPWLLAERYFILLWFSHLLLPLFFPESNDLGAFDSQVSVTTFETGKNLRERGKERKRKNERKKNPKIWEKIIVDVGGF